MDSNRDRLRVRLARWLLLVVIVGGVAWYLYVARGPHSSAALVELWLGEAVLLIAAIALAALIRPAPGARYRRRILSTPWWWLRQVFSRDRRRQPGQRIYARDSQFYRASLSEADLPMFIRRAHGLPDVHDENQFR